MHPDRKTPKKAKGKVLGNFCISTFLHGLVKETTNFKKKKTVSIAFQAIFVLHFPHKRPVVLTPFFVCAGLCRLCLPPAKKVGDKEPKHIFLIQFTKNAFFFTKKKVKARQASLGKSSRRRNSQLWEFEYNLAKKLWAQTLDFFLVLGTKKGKAFHFLGFPPQCFANWIFFKSNCRIKMFEKHQKKE